jgi:hypothetical protein
MKVLFFLVILVFSLPSGYCACFFFPGQSGLGGGAESAHSPDKKAGTGA